MSTFQNSSTIHKPIEAVYDFLSDMNNHEQLMPEEVTDWSSSEDEARFTVKNMIKLALAISQRTAPTDLLCTPVEDAPFGLTLRWKLENLGMEETKATFVIDAELNMMMKMMASGPLQKLVDHQTQRLAEVLG